MSDHKYLRVTMPDGSKWEVPFEAIIKNRAENYEYEGVDDLEQCEIVAATESDEVLIEWAENDMNWEDVSDEARMIEQGTTDYEDGWTNGEKEVIDYN